MNTRVEKESEHSKLMSQHKENDEDSALVWWVDLQMTAEVNSRLEKETLVI